MKNFISNTEKKRKKEQTMNFVQNHLYELSKVENLKHKSPAGQTRLVWNDEEVLKLRNSLDQ